MRRLLESVGLERRARDVTPDLHAYLAGKGTALTQAAAPMSETDDLATDVAADGEALTSGHARASA